MKNRAILVIPEKMGQKKALNKDIQGLRCLEINRFEPF